MFKITKNDLLKNKKVMYKDENGNKLIAVMNDEMNEVTLKLRFNDENISAEAVKLCFPISKDFKGVNINLSVNGDKERYDEAIERVLNDFSEIGSRWLHIPTMLHYFRHPQSNLCEKMYIKKMLKEKEDDSISDDEYMLQIKNSLVYYQLEQMREFEEFLPLVNLF